jgi:hypothetical protein
VTRRRALALLAAASLAACGSLRPAPLPQGPSYAGAAAGPLRVRRIALAFADGRAGATVPRNARLRARATIELDGSGPFRGTWLADGVPVEVVVRSVAAGETLVLETSAATVLPTVEPGPHEISFRVESPAASPGAPVLRYAVAADEGRPDARP